MIILWQRPGRFKIPTMVYRKNYFLSQYQLMDIRSSNQLIHISWHTGVDLHTTVLVAVTM